MLSGKSGRRPLSVAVSRGGLVAAAVIALSGLAACTTTEGTNAFADIGTFEREVMNETLIGVGMLPREQKDEDVNPRGPLVLPKSNAALPPPQEKQTAAALPADSDKVELDATGLTEEDLSRLRKVRVVDPYASSGRPLTQAELAKMIGKMKAARINPDRPLYLPPIEYFTTSVKGQDLVCMAKSGELVPLNDPSCPPEVRKALGPTSG
jgi:hypothetical protein